MQMVASFASIKQIHFRIADGRISLLYGSFFELVYIWLILINKYRIATVSI
jgi:hypothetical protein